MAQRFFSDIQLDSEFTVGVDDTGHNVKFFGATAGSYMLWNQSTDALKLTDATPIQIGDSGDMELYHDGSNSYITNKTGALKMATEASGIAVSIGHATSETTVNDNLNVTGNLVVAGNGYLGDSDYFMFGDGNDLQIIHNGSHGYIMNITGDLNIGNQTTSLAVNIGHTTSEVTIGDNLTVTGTLTANRKLALPSTTVGDHSGGDIYYYGNGSTVKGSIYYINGANWSLADADAVSTSTTLLAVALGTDPDADGMLLRGFVTLLTEVEGTEAIGSTLYLSATDTGIATITAPSGNGDIVRVLGYSLHATGNQVYFNPDNTFVEVTA